MMIASDRNLLFYEFEGHIRDKLAAFLAARPEANKAYIFNTVTQFNDPSKCDNCTRWSK